MSPRTPTDQVVAAPGGRTAARHGWIQALLAVVAGVLVMLAVAALGLWGAGATDLPDHAYPRVVTASVVTAVGGTTELSGDAGMIADTRAGLTLIPLSVTLAGALVIAAGFLRPLRHRAVAGAPELAGWAARIAVLWLPALLALALYSHQKFKISLGTGTISDIGDLIGVSPEVGFRTDVPVTLLYGVLWLAGVLILALLVSRAAPLPARLVRFQASVRPAAYAMVVLLLACVAVGAVVALVAAATRGHVPETFAVIFLGLPNLVWLAFSIGLGATWTGRVDGPFGLPVPHVLDQVLRAPDISTVDLRTLGHYDGKVWWLLLVDVLLLLGAAFLMAARSPARMPAWWHAVRMALALALTVLMICLVGRISAYYGLSLIGIGDAGGGLAGELFLDPKVWSALGLAVLWGLVTGFLGALPAKRVRRKGEVVQDTVG